jgi:aspartate/methionine/tyrosine aminotransferase
MDAMSCYGDVMGQSELRKALLERHGCAAASMSSPASKMDIVVTAGGNQAMANVSLVVLDPGDAAILIAPYYFSHKAAIDLAGAEAIVTGFDKDSFQPNVSEVTRALEAANGRAKMVVVTSPNNPSGVVTEPSRLGALAATCKAHKAWLVIDEAYADITYSDKCNSDAAETSNEVPAAAAGNSLPLLDHQDGIIRLFTFSKNFGMAGWRLGYALYPNILSEAMLKVQDTLSTHATLASQSLGLEALKATTAAIDSRGEEGRAASGSKGEDSEWLAAQVNALHKPREVIWRAVQHTGCVKGQGAYFFCPPLPPAWRRDPTTETMAFDVLANDFKVLVTPGRAFGMPGHFRCSYGSLPDETLAEGANRLHKGLMHLASTAPPS